MEKVKKLSEIIPFFVVDRPMSLKILEFCGIKKLKGKIGLMGHANTSKNFQKLFREFNSSNVIKMADSGVFTKQGNLTRGYENLFKIYENMGVEYGIIIDVIKDKIKTIRSAEKALIIYKEQNPKFKLVGVAQGITVHDYLDCYDHLKKLGFEFIAIGGLLKKIQNTSRYVRISDERFLEEVVKTIRRKYPTDWLFLLGCYHPKRHLLFNKYNIFGADYKGWILNYEPPNQAIQRIERKIRKIEDNRNVNDRDLVELREKFYKSLKKSNKNEIKQIMPDILRVRLRIKKKIMDKDYSKLLIELRDYLNMTEDYLRKKRFIQIKRYLEDNVFPKIKRVE
jgi:hypothetical protein